MATAGGVIHNPPSGPQPSQIQTSPNLVHFDPKAAVPQQTTYLQRNDYLTFNFLTNAAALTISVFYRFLTPEGEIKEGEVDSPPFNGAFATRVPLYEGWLISFGARITGGIPLGGYCFMQLLIERTPLIGSSITRPHALVWQGFITANGFNGFPGMTSKDPTDGAGTLRSVTGTVPAAGADINEVVPLQRRWTLLAIRAQLTASATVANRQVVWQIDDGANIFFKGNTPQNQTAGQVIQYSGFPNAPTPAQVAGDTLLVIPLPLPLKANYRIKTQTTGIQVGDQWTAPQYSIIEWPTWDQ